LQIRAMLDRWLPQAQDAASQSTSSAAKAA
jgi:hypothetical protein